MDRGIQDNARERSCGTVADFAGFTKHLRNDEAKQLVKRYCDWLVSEGYAEWRARDDNDVELRLGSGEVFLFADTTITRIQ
jgi:hypothetical protein